MAELNIRLLIDPTSGKKNIIIEYEADSDALPHEHEEEHRVLIDKLIEGGVVKAEEIGKVVVAREQGRSAAAVEDEAASERESVKQGS
ncbi:hypothetical protein ACNOYE_30530 [Nannocystaceae bacterium ST9]